ncbi:ribosomal protein L7/L12 [Mycolicibacterium sp. 624]|uniref:ribosomal protein L7/L12 n=1 Tax=Mycolicibacterium sp. YH-1 TaxID=2908837 RepID=UPI001F4BFF44|nr:ribosomal protein L7/L12 [Mycolicibacterium sp. YH-1]UNB54373.1 ribosomal protein L7/L12 [Mycolicibacterium sp. YH-1]
MALFGNSDSDLQRRIDALERRVAALEHAALRSGQPAPGQPARPAPTGEFHEGWVSDEVRILAASGKKINAIKMLREQSGLGLKEAKDIVDQL